MAQVQAPGEPVRFGPHRHQTGIIHREIACRTCGRWMHWLLDQPDATPAGDGAQFLEQQGSWWHTADATPECQGSTALH